ncbi:MAG: glycosyltransferase family 39 protein [Limisphaerales bacterium]
MFRPRSIGLLLALVTLLVYLPATSYQFINFDDRDYVTANPVVQKGLTWAGVKWAFEGAHASNWHPLTWLSHMADCDLFHLNPGGPHLVNILFHSFNAALLFVLIFRLTEKMWAAAFIAALFAWHPLHVESVAWISERKDVLSTFFALLTLLSYTRYVKENSLRSYGFSLVFFVLALLSKPMPVTLPVVMLLLDYWPLNRFEVYKANKTTKDIPPSTFKFLRSIIWEKWPFFLLTGASAIITCLAQRNALNTLTNVPLFLRMENALTAYVGYLWKMIWPVDLIIMYPLQNIVWQSIASSIIILSGVSIIVWRERKCCPWMIVGWLWFLVTLVPVIGLVQVGSQAMADRYSYFPLIGIFLAITFSAQALAERFRYLKAWFMSAAVLILGVCVLLTEKQLPHWRDSESLFSHALTVARSEVAYICLGEALHDKNRDSEAMTQYILAWRLSPESELANGNIAFILNIIGNNELAANYYKKALQKKSQYTALYKNYGMVLQKLGHYEEAASQFATAAQLDATSADPQILMGGLFLEQGREVEALIHFRRAMQLDPGNLEIAMFAANLLAAAENPLARNGAEARVLAENLIKRTGDQQPAALDALAMANAELGRFDEAVQLEQKAVSLIQTNGSQEDLAVMQKRLEFYQQHKPWRESFKKTLQPENLNPK